jgi:hypothetical protein
MADFPKVLNLVRGGKRRRCVMVQPYIHQGGCYDILRVGFAFI